MIATIFIIVLQKAKARKMFFPGLLAKGTFSCPYPIPNQSVIFVGFILCTHQIAFFINALASSLT
jgi:hypothetical protein